MLIRSKARALEAYTRVRNRAAKWPLKNSDEQNPERKAYGSLAHRLPALIRTSGLASALVFIETRVKEGHKTEDRKAKGHKAFVEDFKEALAALAKEVGVSKNQSMPITSPIIAELNQTATDITQLVLDLDLASYQLLTLEALALAMWFKRFAESVLDVPPTEDRP